MRRVGRAYILVVCGLFLVTWVAITCAVVWNDARAREPVSGDTPDMFPVLVVSLHNGSYTPQVLPHYKLRDYLGSADEHSFLVPDGMAGQLNRVLQARKRPGVVGQDGFEVHTLPNGDQQLKVVYNWGVDGIPHVETSWYIARPDSIDARYYRTGTVLLAQVLLWLPFTLLANAVLWGAGVALVRIVRRKA